MRYSKEIILLLLTFLFVQATHAQKELKYKDIYGFVLQTDTILSYEKLKMYQQQDPFHANSYYQLGLIAQAWSRKYDPFTQPDDVRYFAYHTKVYFGLAKQYIDDKEVRKNSDYYQTIQLAEGEKISAERVVSDIDTRMNLNSEFVEKYEKIYKLFNRSVDLYNHCVELFLEINRNNTNEKELLLTASPEIYQKVNELQTSYDSALLYLSAFETQLEAYPLKSYKQKHTIKPIETYRLEGLTYSNFLENDITLWNFKQWIDNFNNLAKSDIYKIRTSIDSTYSTMNQTISGFKTTSDYSDSVAPVKINPQVLFKIGKYDYNSVLIDYFNYLESKANYLRFTKKTDNNTAINQTIDLKKKAYFYSKTLENKKTADSLAIVAQKNINSRTINKYNEFVTQKFENEEGFKNNIKKDAAENESIFEASLSNYMQFVAKASVQNQIDTILIFGKHSISFKINKTKTSLAENETATESISQTNKETYISGKVVIASKEKAFVCQVVDKKIKWFKTFENELSSSNSGVLVQAYSSGCFLVVTSMEAGSCINKLVQMSNTGQKINEFVLLENKYPRYIDFDDINEKILIAYYGNSQQANAKEISELLVASYNTELKITPSWTKPASIKINGNFVDIIQINENIYVFSNFHEYLNVNSESMFVPDRTATTQLNGLLTVISKEGAVTKMLPFLSNNYYYLTNIIKIDNNLINLVGVKGIKENENTETKQMKYMLLNGNGELIHTN